MVLDVAVVEPSAGVALAPAHAEALRRPDRSGVDRRPVLGPPVPVHVEGVVRVAEREDVPLDEVADTRMEDRGVAHERAAVDRLQPAELGEDDDVLDVRRALAAPEDRQRAEHPAGDRDVHVGPVVVIRPHAARPGDRGQAVGVALAGLDVAVAARERRQVRAVRRRLVAHAVEVHRVRRVEVQVAEVHEDPVADPRAQQRAGDPPVAARQRTTEPARVLPVDDRVQVRGERVDRHVVQGVLAVRHDVERRGDRRDPVLPGRGGRRCGRRHHGCKPDEDGESPPPHCVTITSPAISGPWIAQK